MKILSWLRKKNMLKLAAIEADKNKFYDMFKLVDDWLNAIILEKKVGNYIVESGYKTIAIYGMSYIGNTLVNELKDADIHIKYGIDRDFETYWGDFPIVSPEEVKDNVDAIIVTSSLYYDEIKTSLENKVSCPILSLEKIIGLL